MGDLENCRCLFEIASYDLGIISHDCLSVGHEQARSLL
jgi:hypothetical protein